MTLAPARCTVDILADSKTNHNSDIIHTAMHAGLWGRFRACAPIPIFLLLHSQAIGNLSPLPRAELVVIRRLFLKCVPPDGLGVLLIRARTQRQEPC